ncbi:tubulin/FtsZ family protein [Natrialbaceae archaeon A-arb3/5]
MQLEVIGVGGAGCRIVDAIRTADSDAGSFVLDAFAFDTDSDCLGELTAIPETHRHRYGETIDAGLNGNLQRGRTVGEEYVDELSRQLDAGQPSLADAFLVVVGLGGATGGGTVPALVSNLQTLYDGPVYVLATLPAERELTPPGPDDDRVEIDDSQPAEDESAVSNEGDGTDGTGESGEHEQETTIADVTTRPLAEENAVRTLDRLEGVADAVVCFDNERWLKTGEYLVDARNRLNRELATRVAAFFSATADASEEGAGTGAETIIDANDVGRIFGNETAITTLGYGKQQIERESGGSRFGLGLFSTEPTVETSAAISAIETTIGKALRGKLTLECERENAARAMLVVGGPPEWLNRRGISDGRKTIESATGSVEILGGDAPRPNSDVVFAVVLLAGVEPVDRLEEIRARVKPLDRGDGSSDE